MTVARLYHSGELHAGREIILDAPAAHHAVKVLRLKPGDALVLFDGQGGEYPARISGSVKSRVTALTGKWQDTERESALNIILAQGISSADKMDFIVQKAVELGVSAIFPLDTRRSVVKLSGARAQKRVEHWRRIAISACEQCGRNRIPAIAEIIALDEFTRQADAQALRVLLSPARGKPLKEFRPPSRIILLAGAEGGFTAAEEQVAHAAGFISATLGPRVLRTETAALAALAALQTLWGDF